MSVFDRKETQTYARNGPYFQALCHMSGLAFSNDAAQKLIAAYTALDMHSHLIEDFLLTRGFDAAVLDAGLCFMLHRRTKQNSCRLTLSE
jgi:hypothetical protein